MTDKALEGEWAEVLTECSEPNWDGYGALPVSRRAIRYAREILLRLGDVPTPEVNADADGEANMEWYRGDGGVFSLSVGPSGRVSWATMRGPEPHDQDHGQCALVNVVQLAPKIRRLFQ